MTSTTFMRFPLDWNPEIQVLHDCLRHEEFARLSLLTRISDLDWQYQVLESLASPLTKTSLLRSWYEASPGEIVPSIALALHLVRKAYDRREDGPAGEAEEWMAEAREIVERVAASEPDDPRIACARIEVARAAGDRGTIRRVWEEASKTHAGFFPLLVAVLTSVSPRFFGTDEEILEFARSQAAGAQPGELRGFCRSSRTPRSRSRGSPLSRRSSPSEPSQTLISGRIGARRRSSTAPGSILTTRSTSRPWRNSTSAP